MSKGQADKEVVRDEIIKVRGSLAGGPASLPPTSPSVTGLTTWIGVPGSYINHYLVYLSSQLRGDMLCECTASRKQYTQDREGKVPLVDWYLGVNGTLGLILTCSPDDMSQSQSSSRACC